VRAPPDSGEGNPEGGTALTVQQTSARKATFALLAILGLIMATFVAAAPVAADHTGPLVQPITTGQATNYDCDDLVEQGFIDGYDDEDQSGDSPSGDGSDEHVSWNATGSLVSFEADPGWLVVAVNVKGGQAGGNVYVYDSFPGGGVDHDNNLVTPDNPNEEPAGISHIVFCLIQTEEEETPTPTPEGGELGGTGTPTASVPDTSMNSSLGGPLATLVFGAVLLASLGALAYANVKSARNRA
jgi:hypothetical protein